MSRLRVLMFSTIISAALPIFSIYNPQISNALADAKSNYPIVTLCVNSDKITSANLETSMPVSSFIYKNRLMAPAVSMINTLGGKVELLEDGNAAVIEFKGITMKMQKDKKAVMIGDKLVTSDVAPLIISNTFVVPVRFVAKHLGLASCWDSEKMRVSLVNPEKFAKENLDNTISEVFNDTPKLSMSPLIGVNYEIYDLDNCGLPEIVAISNESDVKTLILVYKISNGKYEKLTEIEANNFKCTTISVGMDSDGFPEIRPGSVGKNIPEFILENGKLKLVRYKNFVDVS